MKFSRFFWVVAFCFAYSNVYSANNSYENKNEKPSKQDIETLTQSMLFFYDSTQRVCDSNLESDIQSSSRIASMDEVLLELQKINDKKRMYFENEIQKLSKDEVDYLIDIYGNSKKLTPIFKQAAILNGLAREVGLEEKRLKDKTEVYREKFTYIK